MSDTFKLHIHYVGVVSVIDNVFNYIGGLVERDMVQDPDYLTWSIFDEFCEEHGVAGLVERVWYKLPNEDIGSARVIGDDKDAQIRELSAVGLTAGEVDLYLQHCVSEPSVAVEVEQENAEVDVEDDEEVGEAVGADKVAEEQGEDPVEEGGADDPRFQSFFASLGLGNGDEGEGNAAEGVGDVASGLRNATEGQGNSAEGEGNSAEGQVNPEEAARTENGEEEEFDEDEFERQCMDADSRDPALDTDEEWDTYNIKERAKSRSNYQKDKPPYLWLNQTFKTGDEFKDQVLRYVLKTNYDVKLCRWEKNKLAAVCRNENCDWFIYCSFEKSRKKWVVKTYRDCHSHIKSSKARMLKQGVIGRMFRDEARRRPNIKWTDIKDKIMMRYNLSVSKWICQKARRVALDLVIETQAEQFAKLWDYEEELKRSNPDMKTEIVTIPLADGKQLFGKFYICFKALRETWKKCCRPIIGLDGAFLKWELKGEILAAVGRDADNRIYPIAWAIVRVEDNETWGWFVDQLKSDLDLQLGNGFTIISDKQKGLINAVADILPNAEHRHCARHIFANWKKVYGESEYESFFWAIAYSPNMGEYNYNMDILQKYDPEAHQDLLKTDPKAWCRAFFSSNAVCEDVSNNLSESFNKTIKESRKMPVIHMLEDVRRQAMKRISRRYNKAKDCNTKFAPHIMEIFEANRKSSKFCSVIKSSESRYEVIEGSCSYEVNISLKHCACNQWDLTGIPCPHGIYVITEHNRDPEDYVDERFLTTTWRENYLENIGPVNGERLWTRMGKGPIQVPEKRNKRGRPKKYARKKEAHEKASNPTKLTRDGKTVTCSNCKRTGHNKSTCTRPALQSCPPRKRGRPRKTQNDDPWSIHNAPKRWRAAQSQPTEAASQSTQSQPTDQHLSTASVSAAPPKPKSGRGRGRPRGSRGRGRGRGRASDSDAHKPPVFFMSPWTNNVFDVWRPENPTED